MIVVAGQCHCFGKGWIIPCAETVPVVWRRQGPGIVETWL